MHLENFALFLVFWDKPLPRAGLWFTLKELGVIIGSEGYLQSPDSLQAEITKLINIGWLEERAGMIGWSDHAKRDFRADKLHAVVARQLRKIYPKTRGHRPAPKR